MPFKRKSSQNFDLHQACCGMWILLLVANLSFASQDGDGCPPTKRRNVLMNFLVGMRDTAVVRPEVARTEVDLSRIRSWSDLEVGSIFYFEGEAQEFVFQGATDARSKQSRIMVTSVVGGGMRTLDTNAFRPERARIRRRPGLTQDLLPPPVARTVPVRGERAELDLPTTGIRSPQQMQEAALQNFAGTSGISVKYGEHPLSVPLPPGAPYARIDVVFSPEDIQYARSQGLIYENVPLSQLPRGHAYNYVVFADGSIIYGRVDDSWQFGVQIRTLAQSRRMNIRAAGEVLPLQNGQYRFNDDSVYQAALHNPVISGALPEQRIPLRVQNLFDRSIDPDRAADAPSSGVLTRGSPLTPRPDVAPTREQIQALCLNAYFLRYNSGVCTNLFGTMR